MLPQSLIFSDVSRLIKKCLLQIFSSKILDAAEKCFNNPSSIENRSNSLDYVNQNRVASTNNDLETVIQQADLNTLEFNNSGLDIESEGFDKPETIVLSCNTNQKQKQDIIQSDSSGQFTHLKRIFDLEIELYKAKDHITDLQTKSKKKNQVISRLTASNNYYKKEKVKREREVKENALAYAGLSVC